MYKILFVYLVFSIHVFSQKYQPDQILINGKQYDYRFHHLEQYFNYYPEKRIVPNKDSTIFHRNYIAYYEIYENELFLRDIQIKDDYNKLKSVRDKFSFSKEERILLRWVNGVVHIGIGVDDFSKDSLRPSNDNNLFFEIQRGKVKRKLNFGKEEMRIFKKFQWNKFRNTEEYSLLYQKLYDHGLERSEIDVHIFNNVFYYSKRIFLQK
nr:hypothetical protein [uncultured Flavobacterium sp.]